MPRGVLTPGQSLGERCRKCGADEWKSRNQKSYETRFCVPCARRQARTGQMRRRRADLAMTLWRQAQQRAARKSQPFNITVADVRAAWPKDGLCPVLGVPMTTGRAGRPHDDSPSLDRINNAWGYEPGNIAVISQRANKLKNDANADELERLVAWMRSQGLS